MILLFEVELPLDSQLASSRQELMYSGDPLSPSGTWEPEIQNKLTKCKPLIFYDQGQLIHLDHLGCRPWKSALGQPYPPPTLLKGGTAPCLAVCFPGKVPGEECLPMPGRFHSRGVDRLPLPSSKRERQWRSVKPSPPSSILMEPAMVDGLKEGRSSILGLLRHNLPRAPVNLVLAQFPNRHYGQRLIVLVKQTQHLTYLVPHPMDTAELSPFCFQLLPLQYFPQQQMAGEPKIVSCMFNTHGCLSQPLLEPCLCMVLMQYSQLNN